MNLASSATFVDFCEVHSKAFDADEEQCPDCWDENSKME